MCRYEVKFGFALELRSRPHVCITYRNNFGAWDVSNIGIRMRLPFAIAMPFILLATLAAGNGCAKLVTAINELRRSVQMQCTL